MGFGRLTEHLITTGKYVKSGSCNTFLVEKTYRRYSYLRKEVISMMMREQRGGKMFLGLLVVILGVLWLLNNYGILHGGIAKWLFPVLVILVGLRMLMRGGRMHGGAGQIPGAQSQPPSGMQK